MATAMSAFPRRRKLTVTDYYRLAEAGSLRADDRVELIDGEIIEMAPIGSLHASTVGRLTQLLQRAVADRALVWVQMPLRLAMHSEPQPDLMLLKPRPDFYKSAHPTPADVLLLIEVADSSLVYDRDTKFPLYARHGIPEVWLVDLEHRQLVVHRQPLENVYREVSVAAPLHAVTIVAVDGIHLDLSALF